MKPLLITGAAGLLGTNLMADFTGLGLPVVGMDRSVCDLTDADCTTRLVQEMEPSCIIHAAALTGVDWCESHPQETWNTNVEASRTLARVARRIGARLIYISTDSVFDGARGNYGETDEPHPLNVYATCKLAGEQAVLAEFPEALVVRTVIYGWSRPGRTFAEWILSQLTAGVEVPGFDDAVFSPILVNDLGRLLLALLERGISGTCHVAGSEACSKFEFARALAKTFGFDAAQVCRASLRSASLTAPRPLNVSLNTSYVERLLGRAMPNVQAGLDGFRLAAKEQYACV